MTPGDPLDSRLEAASGELRTQLDDTTIPDFEPNKRIAAPVAAIVALFVAVGLLVASPFSSGDTSQVDVADDSQQVEDDTNPVEDPDAPETAEFTTIGERIELTFGQDATQPSNDRERPELGEPVNDPAYGSVVTRLTDAGDRFNRLDSNTRVLVNSDGTLLLTHVDDGTSEAMSVVDLESFDTLTTLDLDEESELTWHPTNPMIVRHLSGWTSANGSLTLLETHVATGETTVIADLTSRIQATLPDATHMVSRHGRPGDGGDFWTWIVRDGNEDPIGAVSYDLATDTIVGTLTELDPTVSGKAFDSVITENLADGPGELLSIVATSDAKYVLVEYRQVTIVHDADFGDFRAIDNAGDSADVVTMPDGTDAYVFVNFNTPSDTYGYLTSVDLDTLDKTPIINLFDDANTSMLVSGTATGRPGWVVLSTFSCKNQTDADQAWTCNKVMLLELGGANRIVSLAHTYRCETDEEASFFTTPNASADRDLSRVFFTTDSGSCTEGGEAFEIIVPEAFADLN